VIGRQSAFLRDNPGGGSSQPSNVRTGTLRLITAEGACRWLSAAALLEFITGAAGAGIVSAWLSCFACCAMRQLSSTPVIVDRHSAAGQEYRCFDRDAVFLLRLEAKQRLAVLAPHSARIGKMRLAPSSDLNNRSHFAARRATPCMKPSAQSVPMAVPSASLHRSWHRQLSVNGAAAA